MSKQVMTMALDALQSCTYDEEGYCLIPDNEDAIAALRSALDAPEPYDQQALELCQECGWKAVIPGEPCLMCAKDAPHVLAMSQALTDAENQPNQYGVSFGMRGPQMTFTIGNQRFTLAYEPDDPGEFEFMRNMLIHAMSVFTPDVKTTEPLSDARIISLAYDCNAMPESCTDESLKLFAHAIEQEVRGK